MKVVKVIAWIVGILAAICGVLYLTAFDVWTVPDDPMLSVSLEPALRSGDLLVVSRRASSGDRGYLVRCADPRPENVGGFIVGRILAKAGEKIDIQGDYVSVDAKRNPSPYACEPTTLKHPQTGEDVELQCSTEDTGEVKFGAYRAKTRLGVPAKATVQTGYVYLVSDNRYMHQDSRDYGQIDPNTCQHIVGRLWGKDGISDTKHRFNVIW